MDPGKKKGSHMTVRNVTVAADGGKAEVQTFSPISSCSRDPTTTSYPRFPALQRIQGQKTFKILATPKPNHTRPRDGTQTWQGV